MEGFAKQFDVELLEPFRNQLLTLARQCDRELSAANGKAETYRQLIMNLPGTRTADLDLAASQVRIGSSGDLNTAERDDLVAILKGLHPWRKGPFDIFGVPIDCEWRSDLKWDRVKDRVAPLKDRKILDIGSSSGYYLFRMVSGKPRLAIGLEPYQTFFINTGYCSTLSALHRCSACRSGLMTFRFWRVSSTRCSAWVFSITAERL